MMDNMRMNLLISVVRILMNREGITVEEAMGKYPLTEGEKETIAAAVSGGE